MLHLWPAVEVPHGGQPVSSPEQSPRQPHWLREGFYEPKPPGVHPEQDRAPLGICLLTAARLSYLLLFIVPVTLRAEREVEQRAGQVRLALVSTPARGCGGAVGACQKANRELQMRHKDIKNLSICERDNGNSFLSVLSYLWL